jgi:hypothetical protein
VTPAAAVLVIVVAAGEAREPATAALLASLEEAVGASLSIRVEEIADGDVSDSAAVRVERDLKATAVATLAWRDAAHLSAVVRVHASRTNSWSTRTIVFTPQDATPERGRTLGLVVAAMWLQVQPTAAPAAAPPTPAPPPVGPPPRPVASSTAPPPSTPRPPPSEKRVDDDRSTSAATARADVARPAETVAAGAPRRFGVGVSGIGALGVEGPASAVGAAIEGVAFVTEWFALRLGASGRTGPVAALPGSDTVATAGAGVEAWVLGAAASATFRFGLRADALAIVHRVRADPTEGGAEIHDRWLPGADFRVQSAVRLGRRVDWLIGAGVEVAGGSTEIREGSGREVVATIPALRLIGETGLRLLF